MSTAPKVLLVAPPGPGRRSAAKILKSLGYRVRTAAEPFEGTARFVERAADLVILSLAEFGRRDTAFLDMVRRRAPDCRVVLLVPEGRRERARRALRAGADACLPDPFHPEELIALVQILAAPPAEVLDLAGASGRAVRGLAREVAHAVNNPLQVLSLLADDDKVPAEIGASLAAQIGRMSDVMLILERFTKLRPPRPTEGHLNLLVREALSVAEARELVEVANPSEHMGPRSSFDPAQLRYAVDVCAELLAARSTETPLPLRVGVHRLTPSQGRGLGPSHRKALRAGRFVEIAFQGKGVDLTQSDFRALERQVIWNHDETRRAHPALGPVAVVAAHHGGRLLLREGLEGPVLGIAIALR